LSYSLAGTVATVIVTASVATRVIEATGPTDVAERDLLDVAILHHQRLGIARFFTCHFALPCNSSLCALLMLLRDTMHFRYLLVYHFMIKVLGFPAFG
jgi:hypothetical protein